MRLSLRDIKLTRVTLNRKRPDVVCELTWWWSSQWRTSTASEALHELERISWGGERSKSWWWLLLFSEKKPSELENWVISSLGVTDHNYSGYQWQLITQYYSSRYSLQFWVTIIQIRRVLWLGMVKFGKQFSKQLLPRSAIFLISELKLVYEWEKLSSELWREIKLLQGGFKQEVVILLNILVTTIFRPILSRAIPTKENGFAISGQYGKLPLSFLSHCH